MAIKIQFTKRKVPYAKQPRGDQWPCFICKQGVDAKKARWIHVHDGGSVAVTPAEAATMDPAADMGAHPVGPECMRKHPELHDYLLPADFGAQWAAVAVNANRKGK
jgi:hypothetical protein